MAGFHAEGVDRVARAAAVMVVAIAIATALVFPFPPMNDGSSHAATAAILAGLVSGDPDLAAWYRFDPLPLPYWLPTLVMAPLVAIVPVDGASWALRILAALVLLLTALAGARLLRDRAPENTVLLPLAALSGFHHAYFLGEVAFALGVPLALLAFAALLRAERVRSRAFAAFSALAGLVYLSHPFALAALGLATGLAWLGRRAREPEARRALDAALAIAALLSALAASFVLGGHAALSGEGADPSANRGALVFDPSPGRLALLATHPLGSPTGSDLPALAIAGVVALALLASLRRGAATPLLLPAAALALLVWLGPAGLEDPYGFEDIGERFALPAFLLGLGAVRLRPSLALRASLLAAVVLFAAFRLHDTGLVHARHHADASRLARLLDEVPPRSRLLPLFDVRDEAPEDWLVHRFGNWVVPLRGGYSPHVFARTGQQPLRHVERGDYRPVHDLRVTETEWATFDHVLVQSDAPAPRVPGLSSRASLVAVAPMTERPAVFTLWRVSR
jgi:hypothetical protein